MAHHTVTAEPIFVQLRLLLMLSSFCSALTSAAVLPMLLCCCCCICPPVWPSSCRLQELFLSSLLPDRKLKVLEQQPLQVCIDCVCGTAHVITSTLHIMHHVTVTNAQFSTQPPQVLCRCPMLQHHYHTMQREQLCCVGFYSAELCVGSRWGERPP
jgi:hypothetical protein